MVADERKADDTDGLENAWTNDREPFRWITLQLRSDVWTFYED